MVQPNMSQIAILYGTAGHVTDSNVICRMRLACRIYCIVLWIRYTTCFLIYADYLLVIMRTHRLRDLACQWVT